MNDEFMYRLQKAPRAGFADALYERISRKPESRLAGKLTFRSVVMGFALMLFVAACAYVVAERGPRKVAGMWVYVEKKQLVTHRRIPVTRDGMETQPQDMGCVPVEEARETLRFDLRVPTWAPDGFTFDGLVCGVDWMGQWASLYWRDWINEEEWRTIQLTISSLGSYNWHTQKHEFSPGIVGPVAPGSYKEVDVNGQPAVLVRGDWDVSRRDFETTDQTIEIESNWDSKLAIQLHWVVDGEVQYQLYTFGNISPEDLIRMAESAR